MSLTRIRAILCLSALLVLCGLLYSHEMNYSDTQVYSEKKMAPRQIQIEEDTLQFLSLTEWNLFSWEWISSRMCLTGGKLHRRLCVQFQIANSRRAFFSDAITSVWVSVLPRVSANSCYVGNQSLTFASCFFHYLNLFNGRAEKTFQIRQTGLMF